MFFDTHCHLTNESILFNKLSDFICSNHALVVSTSVEDSINSVNISKAHKNLYAAVGLHPWFINKNSYLDIKIISKLCREEKIFAIGEIGLDFHSKIKVPHDLQIDILQKQLDISVEFNLPVSIHVIKSHQLMLKLLSSYSSIRGIVHGFNGSYELAMNYYGKGFLIGIGAMVLSANSNKLRTAIKKLPLESMVFETDYPNTIKYGVDGLFDIHKIVDAVSKIRDESKDVILEKTTQNAKKILILLDHSKR